jgi:cardiolipin synthase
MKRDRWEREFAYFSNAEYFPALVRGIQESRHSIELETYILEPGTTGDEVLQALAEASLRGVRVRLLVDGLGSLFWLGTIRERLRGSRVELRVFHALAFWGKAFAQMNRRLHRKICIFDHRIAFVGSFNITHREQRDTSVQVEGLPVKKLLEAFERAWEHQPAFFKKRESGLGLVRLNETRRMRRQCNRDLVRRIREARHRIWITNAYFVPPFFLLRALCLAGLRGVDVRLLLPAEPDHLYMKWLSEAYYQTLILSGIRVLEFQGPFLHAKTALIDHSTCMAGSTNLNHRSLIHDLEVDVLLTHEETGRIFETQFLKDAESSREVSLESIRRKGILNQMLRWLVHFFRYWA